MPQRHRPAVHVHFRRIEFQFPDQRHRLHRKRLIEFVKVHRVAVPPQFPEQFLNRLHRRHHHHRRLDPADGLPRDPRHRLFAEPLRRFL